ncbi:unnamed protein product [Hermetia illucens]|uniref:Glycosyltransferase family 92 protein n=2 Tax=Hermetia illucens TaxID=343691 RepID=A0A7R8UT42_HERIL|nr:unnamed protein product [Hermetia illucens]
MSFLIVVAFFAVFGLIILTELFMIDDKQHGGMIVLRHGNLGSRLGDSMPDYDNVKEDYDLIDGSLLLGDNKLAFFQFRSDSKLKLSDRIAGGAPVASDSNAAGLGGTGPGNHGTAQGLSIPWGQMLPTKIEQTLPHFPTGSEPTDGSWQVVNGTRFKFFVFSAYYDRRDGKMVRVIGATKTRGPEKVWCRFWYSYKDINNRTKYYSATVMARVKIIRENWNLKYSACFVLCPLRAPGLYVPQAVSVVSRLRAPPGNILTVRNTDQDSDFTNRTRSPTQDIPNKMAVCVKPFHFSYNKPLYLLEFLELNTLLGVSHFTFYNHTLGSYASCILHQYERGNIPENLTAYDEYDKEAYGLGTAGILKNRNTTKAPPQGLESVYIKPTVDILSWNLRMRSQKEIRTEGLFSALNDCLYRNMYRYAYLALIDLDEFIIPRHNDTLIDLTNWLNTRFAGRNTGAYSFQNAFFYLQFADDVRVYDQQSSNPALRAALLTQRKTRRRSKLHPQKQRSKYICKPEAVVEAGNHFVWEFVPGKGTMNVPADAGILHHYRVCEFGGDDCIKAPSLVDRTALKYQRRLLDRVETVYNYLKRPCNLPDIPPPPTRPPPTRKKTLHVKNSTNSAQNAVDTRNGGKILKNVDKIKAKMVA